MNIEELRDKIDGIDDEILSLIADRYQLVKEVGEIKKSSSAGVYVPEREKTILDRLLKKTSPVLPQEAISSIFREIMSGARLLENPITIVYLKNDLLSIIAAYSKFGSCVKLKGLCSVEEICSELQNNLNSYAVVAAKDNPLPPSKQPELKIISELYTQNPFKLEQCLKYLVIGK